MVGILQVNGFGEESTLMQDLKPFRILISLLDKPELGNICCCLKNKRTCAFVLFHDNSRMKTLGKLQCAFKYRFSDSQQFVN